MICHDVLMFFEKNKALKQTNHTALYKLCYTFSPTARTPHRLANRVHVHLSAGGVELATYLHHFFQKKVKGGIDPC